MKNKLLLSIVLVFVFMALTGCSKSQEAEETSQNVSFVLGINENFPQINYQSEIISEAVYDAAYSYGSVSAIVADGRPFVGSDFSIQKPTKNIDHDKRQQLTGDNTTQILAQMTELAPKTAEIDLLTAIDLSADMLHANAEGTELHMKIVASGLCTTGLLDMTTQNIVDESVDSLLGQLTEIHALPDLTGIHVIWIGFGQVSGRQDAMTTNYEYKLEERWEAILTEAGAASVKFDRAPLADEECVTSLPSCSVVPIVEDILDVDKITESNLPEIVKWDGESKISFLRNQDKFVNEEDAMKELEPVAAYLKANPKETIHVFGMTATVNGESLGIELSRKRAEAVKSLLVSVGADEEQIVCSGLGQVSNPLRVNDIDENGMQIDEMAQKNRAVFLIKGDSEMVELLLNCSGTDM